MEEKLEINEEKKKKKDHKDHKVEKLKKEIEDLKEENLRSKAELINYLKRKDEEVVRTLKYANEELFK